MPRRDDTEQFKSAKRKSHLLCPRVSVKKFRPAVALVRAMDALLPSELQGRDDAGRQDHEDK